MNDRIIIEKYIGKERDKETNELIEKWDKYYSCWCEYKALSGKKFAEQNSTHYKRVDSFKIIFCNKSKVFLYEDLEKYRIIFKGRIYKILYPYDIKNEHEFIDLECEFCE